MPRSLSAILFIQIRGALKACPSIPKHLSSSLPVPVPMATPITMVSTLFPQPTKATPSAPLLQIHQCLNIGCIRFTNPNKWWTRQTWATTILEGRIRISTTWKMNIWRISLTTVHSQICKLHMALAARRRTDELLQHILGRISLVLPSAHTHYIQAYSAQALRFTRETRPTHAETGPYVIGCELNPVVEQQQTLLSQGIFSGAFRPTTRALLLPTQHVNGGEILDGIREVSA